MFDVLPRESRMPALDGAITWLNSPPLTPADLRGKVVLVDFWTYTCINWLRTLPYIRAWSEKYAEYGVVVIGVHTPEYDFEGELDNVRRATAELDVRYPVAVDSGYAIWNAFANHYWPALYIVDQSGRIRHHQYGEGGYDEAEKVVQRLLMDAGVSGFDPKPVAVEGRGLEAPADWSSLQSPETYLGDDRAERFSSPGGAARGISRTYEAPPRLRLNHWALSGTWTIQGDGVVVEEPGGRIAYSFAARDVHMILGPAMRGSASRFRVRLDGQPPGRAAGGDVDENGEGTITEQKLYQLIRQHGPIAESTFEIEFLDSGAHAYSFTFG